MVVGLNWIKISLAQYIHIKSDINYVQFDWSVDIPRIFFNKNKQGKQYIGLTLKSFSKESFINVPTRTDVLASESRNNYLIILKLISVIFLIEKILFHFECL